MTTITAVWLCLITHVVYGTATTITVNNNDNASEECCKGNCTYACSSFSSALKYMQNDTMVNIGSEVVTLNDIVGIGSDNTNLKNTTLKNIAIIGNGAIVMCNNTGGVCCESCSDITIRGITWYQCGCEGEKHTVPALNFTGTANVNIHNCTFKNSKGCLVYLTDASENIMITDSYFINNVFDGTVSMYACAGLYINSFKNHLKVFILSSKFWSNRCGTSEQHNYCSSILIESFSIYGCEPENIIINNTDFLNNSHGLSIENKCNKSAVQLTNVNVSDNTAGGISMSTRTINIDMSFVTFINNVNPLSIVGYTNKLKQNVTITMSNLIFDGNTANDNLTNSVSSGVLKIDLTSNTTSVNLTNCDFCNNFNGAVGIRVAPYISTTECKSSAQILFSNVTVYNSTTNNTRFSSAASVFVETARIYNMRTTFTDVKFTSNNYSRYNEEILFLENKEICDQYGSSISIDLTNSTFNDNTAFDHVVSLRIKNVVNDASNQIQLSKCKFDNNFGGESIVYIDALTSISLDNSIFSNNNGTAMHIISNELEFMNLILFINNTANSGTAIYFEEVHSVSSDNATVQFISNTAVQRGGALYFNLVADYCNVLTTPFNASFVSNSANVAGNSIYFSIPRTCHVVTNSSSKSSIMYIPNKFNYSQPTQTKLSPVVTTPYSIKLYPPAVARGNSSNDINYVIPQSKMLGEPIQFTASVFDYFDNVTEPVIFSIDCKTCGDNYTLSAYQIRLTIRNQSLNQFKVFPTMTNDVVKNVNISITLFSVLDPMYSRITAALSTEISPCRPGYLFDKSHKQCICYTDPDIIHCIGDYSEIKIGYWIGFLKEQYTSSICPSHYCNFAKRTETSPGHCDLPRMPDDQCSSHRTGVACGECKPGYTLAYDSPDCINKDKCSAGMTVLVIMLTILYWITIVAAVFGLMYFQFQISSGYVYGIIYYYSIVDILLGNNISDEIFQLVAVLSSFAKLTPQLFGQLCLVEGLSGIDQQFIHYVHALAVSLILLVIVLATRYSPRLAVFVSRCIISVICLLLLLSYTSLASTSLQLLRPLTFNDVDEVRTYSSPDIKYFTGRHLAYAIVAILCEVIIVIGLPLFLLLEPLLRRKIKSSQF